MFSLECCITAFPEFNQSLLDFFSFVDLQLIFTLLETHFLNVVINWVQFWPVGSIAQEKWSWQFCAAVVTDRQTDRRTHWQVDGRTDRRAGCLRANLGCVTNIPWRPATVKRKERKSIYIAPFIYYVQCVSEKTTLLWLATTSTYINRFW